MSKYIGRINQYDYNDNLVGKYEGDLKAIIEKIEYGDKFYYKFPCFSDVKNGFKEKYSHFGVNGIDSNGHYYRPAELVNRSLNYDIQKYYRRRKVNNMYNLNFENQLVIYAWQLQANELLSQNNKEDFNNKLEAFLNRHKQFIQISDLNPFRTLTGLYLLVLDKYNVCYIGQTQSSIMRRIKQHWTRSDYFQKGIDRFKAMDTTRIYVYPITNVENINEAEYICIPDFPEQYTLNCGNLGGDIWFQKNHAPLKNIEPNKARLMSNLDIYLEQSADTLGITIVR